jgi:hypothetical protein
LNPKVEVLLVVAHELIRLLQIVAGWLQIDDGADVNLILSTVQLTKQKLSTFNDACLDNNLFIVDDINSVFLVIISRSSGEKIVTLFEDGHGNHYEVVLKAGERHMFHR